MKRLLLLLATLTVATTFARQGATPAADTTLTARIDRLEAKNSNWEKILSRLPEISGYVQLNYDWTDNGTSAFRLKRVRVSLAGDIVPKLDYRIQVELAKPQIVDAYLQWQPFGQLNFRLGQYKIPFSIENTEYAPLKFEFIDYPLALSRMMGSSETIGGKTLSATGRDLGLTFWGGFFERDGYRIVNYDLGIFNGEGINTKDANKSKDIVARLMIKPLAGLTFAGSYYRGEFGPECLERTRYGAGACYDRGPVVVRGEWIGGTTGTLPAEELPAGSFDSSGWYVMGGWRIVRSFMAAVRYDTLLADTARRRTRQTNYTVGLTWQPYKYLRCQLNYTYENYKIAAKDDCNSLSVMISGIF